MGIDQLNNHAFILKITQQNSMPMLLRKQTSCNEPAGKEIASNLLLENIGAQPTSIHHRKNPQSRPKTQKQFAAQINYMRFIYRYLQMFPSQQGDQFSEGLCFIATKQMLTLIENLTNSLSQQNAYNFEGWDQFKTQQQKMTYYNTALSDYGIRYQKNKRQFEAMIGKVKKYKALVPICDTNYSRSQLISLLSIKYTVQYYKQLWTQLEKQQQKYKMGQNNKKLAQNALRLDYSITYYQLNCLLIENFHDPDYFARNSKIDVIVDNTPLPLGIQQLSQLQHKLKLLEIVR